MHDLDRSVYEQEDAAGELPGGSGLGEQQESELASALLELGSDQELDQFLGDLVKGAASAAGQFLRSDTGQALTGVLKSAARDALPIVGRAVGGWAVPGGGDVGARVGQAAADVFGLEVEGLSQEDRDWEVARGFIRFADAAARNAALAPSHVPAAAVVRRAIAAAARDNAPGLVSGGGRRRSGRWERHGRTIVIFDN
ncbi:hypothetical protein Lfu02_13220 [Longispora fulva]|uniref:Uncharacterized protein n=1 Tax=Longispora fulva TaxID=619741 RepID=A0A8J7GN69_9ACTN|nr:hypothetical protein [Longispora fulva]MBG6134818.1 hypothetical protein [Longispora fulva]GIG56950.1 hypothetical protein Lfu02_13220 [Longispora fulva]